MRRYWYAAILLVAALAQAQAGQAYIAVAANFIDTAKEIAAAFKAHTGHDAILSSGSSGQFYTQIKQQAPFEVFLSADETRPKALAQEGEAVAGSRFTYAVGQLVLWSRSEATVKDGDTLKNPALKKIAIANPVAAPYGAAAIETLQALKLYEVLKPKIVEGSSIAQAFQFVETGNADLGFIALSQIITTSAGSRWQVPQHLYTPIRQDAILLKRGERNEAAIAFLAFLKHSEARAIIGRHGYAFE